MALNMNKLKMKVSKLKGGSDPDFFDPAPGDTEHVARVIAIDGEDLFLNYHFHYNLPEGKILCPKRNFGEECAVCDYASGLYKEYMSGGEKDAELKSEAIKYFSSSRCFLILLPLGTEDDGIKKSCIEDGLKIWAVGDGIAAELTQKIQKPRFGDITDLLKGNNIIITKKKKGGKKYAEWSCEVSEVKTSLYDVVKEAGISKEKLDKILSAAPNIDEKMKPHCRTSQQTADLARKMLNSLVPAEEKENLPGTEKKLVGGTIQDKVSTESVSEVDQAFQEEEGLRF